MLDKLLEIQEESVMATVLMVMEYFQRLNVRVLGQCVVHMWCWLCCIKGTEKDLTCLILPELKEWFRYLH